MTDSAPQTPPGWYPDPEQPQTQRYWDGQQWTEQRAPAAPKKPVFWDTRAAGILAVALIVFGILYFSGRLDKPLSKVGLNWNECVEVVLTGNTICGDELEDLCSGGIFARVNRDECAKLD